MKSSKKIIVAIAAVFMLISCNKYLDVQPVDKLLDKQVFSSVSSIRKALNGIYINLVTENLYGGRLTATTLDVMGQCYNAPSANRFNTTSQYQFLDGSYMQSDISVIWVNAYQTILNINEFIQGVSKVPGTILSQDEKNIMLGEAYGLRAFVAFDMLRLFGPVYNTDSASALVPYPTSSTTKLSPLIPAHNFVDTLIQDLGTAKILLVKDPIISNGIQPFDNTGLSGNFLKARNRRINYYAVEMLLARVYLYRGDKSNALKNALEVMSIASRVFPWTPEGNSRPGNFNIDRIFSSEIIFGPENTLRDNLHKNYFAATNIQSINSTNTSSATLLAPMDSRLSAVYENQDNDYRLRSSWAIDRKENYNFKTFTKYAPLSPDNSGVYPVYRNIQPLIRLSESYYIAAECSDDPQQAALYLNTVRMNRGLLNPVAAIPDLSGEITKEYQKEFWGEGQLFFYYKRKNMTTIQNASASSGSINMGVSNYMAPLPLSETQYR